MHTRPLIHNEKPHKLKINYKTNEHNMLCFIFLQNPIMPRYFTNHEKVGVEVAMDCFDMNVSTGGFRHVCVMVEFLSGFIWTKALITKRADDIAFFFDSVIRTESLCPSKLRLDNGLEFRTNVDKILQSCGGKAVRVTAYKPRSNVSLTTSNGSPLPVDTTNIYAPHILCFFQNSNTIKSQRLLSIFFFRERLKMQSRKSRMASCDSASQPPTDQQLWTIVMLLAWKIGTLCSLLLLNELMHKFHLSHIPLQCCCFVRRMTLAISLHTTI